MKGPKSYKKVKRGITRRQFFNYTGRVFAATAIGYGTAKGSEEIINNTKDDALDLIRTIERELRELKTDYNRLLGVTQDKLYKQAEELKDHYDKQLKFLNDAGIAPEGDLNDIKKILDNIEEYKDRYTFSERFKQLKDKVDKRLLTLDQKIEDNSPGWLQGLNDKIRDVFGKPTKEEGKKHRKEAMERLENLCKIYTANEDNLRAQEAVLKEMNKYISETTLSKEEKEFYKEMKKEWAKEGGKERVKDYILGKAGESYGLKKLQQSLKEAENLYKVVEKDIDHVKELQKKIEEGHKTVDEIREKEISAYKEYSKSIDDMRKYLDDKKKQLKEEGIEVTYVKDEIEVDTVTDIVAGSFDNIAKYVSGVIGVLTGLVSFSHLRKLKVNKEKRWEKAYNELSLSYGDLRILNRKTEQEKEKIAKSLETEKNEKEKIVESLETEKNEKEKIKKELINIEEQLKNIENQGNKGENEDENRKL